MWLSVPSSVCVPGAAGSTEPPAWLWEALASSATLSGRRSPPRSWRTRWKREEWLRLLCGRICEPSTAARGVESWIGSLRASRAKETPSPASELPQGRRVGLPLFAPGPGLGGAGVVDDIIDLLARDPGKAWRRFEAERRNTLRWLRWAEALAVAPGVEPAIRGLAHGVAGARRDWLRLLGNGVVDLQGAAAIRLCLDALEGDHG